MLELYHGKTAVCAVKARLAVVEKGVDWQGHILDLFKGDQFNSDYLKLNPKAVVPTLVHNGKVIVESTLICEYLDEVFPDPALMPSDPYQRARVRLWGKTVDEKLHLGVASFSFSALYREKLAAMTPEARQAHFDNMADFDLREVEMSTFELGVDSPHVMRAIQSYEKAFDEIDKWLSSGGPWIMGKNYSLAEIYLTPYLFRLECLGLLDIWLDHLPQVQDWYSRIKSRPSFKTAVSGYADASYIDQMRASGAKIKDQLLQKRTEYLKGKAR